jgi:intracellular sulfur oxidation DsrE/DsrF family protein
MRVQWSRWLWSAAVAASLVVLGSSTTEASHLKENPKKHKIVYHLNEPGVAKAKFVLGNIQNHVKGVGSWENIEALELVVHGPGLKTFLTKEMDPEIKQALEQLQTQGLAFGACGNTMKAFNITLEQLPDGAKHLPQGGVVRIMELQDRGYAYLRP